MKTGSSTLITKSQASNLAWGLSIVSITAIGAQLAIPIQPVPVTLQTLAVMAVSVAAGLAGRSPRSVGIAQIAYLAAGGVGLPVFANLAAGPAHLMGATAGYLWSFPVLAFLSALIGQRLRNSPQKPSALKSLASVSAMAVVSVVSLALGTTWLSLFIGWGKAIEVGFLPFLFVEFVKAAVAGALISLVELKRLGGSDELA
jgi:biotin transport system substrate-specific component